MQFKDDSWLTFTMFALIMNRLPLTSGVEFEPRDCALDLDRDGVEGDFLSGDA